MPRRVHGCGCDTENKTVAGSKILSLPLIVDKPLVCQRGLPGRLSSHCASIQHGRPTSSHRAAFSGPVFRRCGRLLGVSSRLQPLRGLRCSQARLWHSLLHWGLRTGLRFAGPVFRGCGALRAVLAPSPLRGFDGNGLFRAQRAAFVRPAVGGPVFRRCALRVLAPPAASRPPTASDRDGNAFLPQTQAFALQKMPEMTYTPSFLI